MVETRNSRPALSLVARDEDGRVAAYVQTSEFDAFFEATGVREAYVNKVGTVPDHRRRGLAAALLRLAVRSYRDAGYGRASLDVDSENPTGALGLYESIGFSDRPALEQLPLGRLTGRELEHGAGGVVRGVLDARSRAACAGRRLPSARCGRCGS